MLVSISRAQTVCQGNHARLRSYCSEHLTSMHMQRKGAGLYFVAIEKHLHMSLRLFFPGLCGKFLVFVIKIMSGMSGEKNKKT